MWRLRVLFWRALLPNVGRLTGVCVQITVVVSLMISMVNFYLRPRHSREGDRTLNPHNIGLDIPPSSPTSSTRTSHTCALQAERRIPSTLRSSRKRRFFAPRIRATQGMPKHKHSSRRSLGCTLARAHL